MEGSDFIGRQIRRTNRNLFLTGTVILGLVGGWVGLGWRDVRNYLFGPYPVRVSDLRTMSKGHPSERFYVEVKGESSYESSTQVVKPGHPDQVLARIIVLLVESELLLVKTPSFDPKQLSFKGTAMVLPWDVRNRIVLDWNQKHPQMRAGALPLALDATGIWDRDSVFVAVFAGLFIGVGLFLVGLSARRMILPDQHPLLLRLAQYGELSEVQSRIDQEVEREGGGEKFGALQLTSNWLIHAWSFRTRVMANQDIVWGYAKETKHYHNGIPTGTTYTALVRDSKGQEIEVKAKKGTLPKIMETLGRRNPWMVVGFTKELEELWKKDRPKFLELVEKRRTAGTGS